MQFQLRGSRGDEAAIPNTAVTIGSRSIAEKEMQETQLDPHPLRSV